MSVGFEVYQTSEVGSGSASEVHNSSIDSGREHMKRQLVYTVAIFLGIGAKLRIRHTEYSLTI